MGSLLMSAILIFAILELFKEENEIKLKMIIGICSFFAVMIISIIFNINIIFYIIAAVSVGVWLHRNTNIINYSKKVFLTVICVLTFFSINVWGIIGSFVLCSHFDYGIINGVYKGFTSMNSSYEFTIELVDELMLQSNNYVLSEKLNDIKEKITPEIQKIDNLKTIIELANYL